MNKKSFVLHVDSLSILDKLSDEQAGKLFKAIRDYNEGILPDLDFALDLAFTNFKNQFDRDADKWLEIKEKRILAGAKGGKQKVANVANATKTKQKPPVSVSGNVSVNVSVSEYIHISDFKKMGYDWNLSQEVSRAFDNFLEYRNNRQEPITDPKVIESIIKNIYLLTKDDDAIIFMFDNTISKSAKNVITDLKDYNAKPKLKYRNQDNFSDYFKYVEYCQRNKITPEPQTP